MSRANSVAVIVLNSELLMWDWPSLVHSGWDGHPCTASYYTSGESFVMLGGDDESHGHTELECLFHWMPAETRQTSRNKEAVRHYSFQSNLTSQGRWFIMVITRRLTLAGEQRAVPEIILEHRSQIWRVMAMMSRFTRRRPFWSCTANEVLWIGWMTCQWKNAK